MTAIYDNLGVRFVYPENWQLTHEQRSHMPYELSLQTPGGGFWSLDVYDELADPAKLASETLSLMQHEYEDLEFEPLDTALGDFRAVGYELNFYCLDLVVTARVLGIRFGHLTLLVLYQADSQEFDKLEQVFEAVTLGLVRADI